MADTRGRLKRFKTCKIRVNTRSTKGKKVSRSISLKADKYSRRLGDNFNVEPDISASELDEALDEPRGSTDSMPTSLSKHQLRRIKENNSWIVVRENILKGRLEGEAFVHDSDAWTECVECNKNAAICRCLDCGSCQYFCLDCAKSLHEKRNHFHQLERFKDGCFVPLMINHTALSLAHQKNCPGAEERIILCIDQNGHQHQKMVLFCPCEEDAVTLVKLQLWPGSATRPQAAFHFKLMILAEILLLECHVSLKKFCDTLGLKKSNMLPKWVKNVYQILNSGSFDEFRYHQYLFRTMKPYLPQHLPDSKFPLCPEHESETNGTHLEDVMIESMDGCFGLVRKKSAGSNIVPPRHSGTFFASSDEVDSFVDNYCKSAKEAPMNCNEFKAGEVDIMIRSKGKNKLFDEKGVFGRVCRHEYPKGFISMKHGERIAYSVFEVERLLSSNAACIDVKITYDISCTLQAHLEKNDRQDILSKVDLAIPVFHSYGHKSLCQVGFSPRRKSGFGLTDGEGIERLWAYLRGFSSITKEMTTGRRIDVLTDALLHYAQHRINQFGPSLLVKMKKAKELLESTKLQLDEIFSNLQVSFDASLVELWADEEKSLLLSRNTKKALPVTWEAKYVQNLSYLEELGHCIAAEDAENHEAVNDLMRKRRATLKITNSMERKHQVKKRWKVGEVQYNSAVRELEDERKNRVLENMYSLAVERIFLLTLKRKYADGQKIAMKLSKQITKKTNTLKVSVEKYNASLSSRRDRVEGLPSCLDFDSVKDPESPIYQDFKGVADEQVPFSIKRTVIDLHCLTERCKEEIELVDIEIARLVKYHTDRKRAFQEFVEKHSTDPALYMKGLCCIMQKRVYEEENKLYLLGCLLSNDKTEILFPLPQQEYKFVSIADFADEDLLEESELQDAPDSDSDCEDDEDDDVFEIGNSDGDDDDDDDDDDGDNDDDNMLFHY